MNCAVGKEQSVVKGRKVLCSFVVADAISEHDCSCDDHGDKGEPSKRLKLS
jgi:hypothetical protein